MSGRVLRMIRCGEKRLPRWIGDCVRVAIDISVGYGSDRTPEAVMIFGVPTTNGRVGACSIQSGEESGGIGDVEVASHRQRPERPGILAAGVVRPKEAYLSLFRSSHRAIDRS